MNRSHLAASALTILLSNLMIGCGESGTEPGDGTIEVMLTITGVDVDPDGGTVSCDGGDGRLLVPDVPVTFYALHEGDHVLSSLLRQAGRWRPACMVGIDLGTEQVVSRVVLKKAPNDPCSTLRLPLL